MLPVAGLLRRTGPIRRRAAAEVKARLAEARQERPDPIVVDAAATVAALRDELAGLVGCGNACASCATGYPLPEGTYDGGRCCGGATSDVFQPVEIDLLAARGVGPEDLGEPPREPDGGCAFRGRAGCSLPLRARPTICIHYVCSDLMAELAERGDAPRVGELREELADAMRVLAKLTEERRADAEFEAVFGAVRSR